MQKKKKVGTDKNQKMWKKNIQLHKNPSFSYEVLKCMIDYT